MTLLALATPSPLLLYAGQEYGETGIDAEGYSGYDGRTTIFDYWAIPSLGHRDPVDPTYQSYLRLMQWAQHPVILRGAFHSIQEQARQWGGFNAERTYGYLRLLDPAAQQTSDTIGIAVLGNFTADPQRYPLFFPISEERDDPQQLMRVTTHAYLAAPQEQLYAFQPWAPLTIELAPYSVRIVELQNANSSRISG